MGRSFLVGLGAQNLDGQLLAELSRRSPLLPGADRVSYVDIDDTVKATYGLATPSRAPATATPG